MHSIYLCDCRQSRTYVLDQIPCQVLRRHARVSHASIKLLSKPCHLFICLLTHLANVGYISRQTMVDRQALLQLLKLCLLLCDGSLPQQQAAMADLQGITPARQQLTSMGTAEGRKIAGMLLHFCAHGKDGLNCFLMRHATLVLTTSCCCSTIQMHASFARC